MEIETYLYPYSANEARKRGELALWRASHQANISCKRAIEESIRQNFDGMRLNNGCVEDVYKRQRQSYASALTSFGNQPHDLWADFPLIEQAHRRLARVVIENKDFEKLIRHYDRPESLFYCDPPYHCTEGYYSNIGEDGFTEKDHIRLRDALMSIQGKFLLSYNDDPFVRELYDAPGIQIEPVTRLNLSLIHISSAGGSCWRRGYLKNCWTPAAST